MLGIAFAIPKRCVGIACVTLTDFSMVATRNSQKFQTVGVSIESSPRSSFLPDDDTLDPGLLTPDSESRLFGYEADSHEPYTLNPELATEVTVLRASSS